MTSLIACLSTGKGTWGHVSQLMQQTDWEQIFLITNSFGKEKFSHDKEFTPIIIDSSQSITEIVQVLMTQLQGKIIDTEVALNLISGTGHEHMAILSAVLQLGLGIRLVVADEKEMKLI